MVQLNFIAGQFQKINKTISYNENIILTLVVLWLKRIILLQKVSIEAHKINFNVHSLLPINGTFVVEMHLPRVWTRGHRDTESPKSERRKESVAGQCRIR